MQIYALDSDGKIVTSTLASRSQTYFCPECEGPLRLRGDGKIRRLHFYHSALKSQCRSSGKSWVHEHIQKSLKKALHPEEIWIEHSFPEIKRIADVVWPSKKLIFEIQCSSISAQEITRRNQDYAQMGFTVIWIFHDRQFNREKAKPAEMVLRSHPHYFVKLNLFGRPKFYDQHALLFFNTRFQRTAKLKIDLAQVFFNQTQFPSHYPKERKKWGLNFKGDLYDRAEIRFVTKRFSLFRIFRSLYLSILENATD